VCGGHRARGAGRQLWVLRCILGALARGGLADVLEQKRAASYPNQDPCGGPPLLGHHVLGCSREEQACGQEADRSRREPSESGPLQRLISSSLRIYLGGKCCGMSRSGAGPAGGVLRRRGAREAKQRRGRRVLQGVMPGWYATRAWARGRSEHRRKRTRAGGRKKCERQRSGAQVHLPWPVKAGGGNERHTSVRFNQG